LRDYNYQNSTIKKTQSVNAHELLMIYPIFPENDISAIDE